MGVIRFPYGTRLYQIDDEFEAIPFVLLPDMVVLHITAMRPGSGPGVRLASIALADEKSTKEIPAYRFVLLFYMIYMKGYFYVRKGTKR